MKPLIYDDELARIKISKDLWIDIKEQMAYIDEQKLSAHYLKLEAQLDQARGKNAVNVDLESGNIELLLINIKAWNIADRDGEIAPINRETIGRLNRNIASKLVHEIRKRNPVPKV